jgi:hypothetical protein
MLDSNYLEKIASKSANHINENFGFSKFDDINIYLIKSALQNKFNLWLNVNKKDIDKYYLTVIYALFIIFYERNILNTSNSKVRVGNKYEKGKKVYEVIETFSDKKNKEFIKLKCIARGKDEITSVVLDFFHEDYIEIDDEASSRSSLREMKKLINKIGYQKIISKYSAKFAIVGSKKYFEDSFTSLIPKEALPYEYITKTETLKPNRPLKDFMFFVTSDYDTIQEYIFDEEEIDLDLIVFFGSRSSQQVNSDLARGSVKQVIYINDEKPNNEDIVKWKWTPPELQYFKDTTAKGSKKPICINNEKFEELKASFTDYVDAISSQNKINLDFIYPYFTYLYPIVILSGNSRLNNKINDLGDRFKNVIEKKLFQELKSIGRNPEPIIEKLLLIYIGALNQIVIDNNSKAQHLREMRATDYLLVPSEQTLEVWKHELKKIGWNNTKAITINKLQKIDHKSSVTVIAIKDMDLFKMLYGGIHDVQWLLYNAEYNDFKSYKARYSNELIKELKSSDRKKLTGIDFPNAEEDEIPSDMISRIIEKTQSHGIRQYEVNEYDHIQKRIFFSDNTEIVRSINSSLVWVDRQNNDKAIKYLVGDLRPDDTVRVYENTHKEKLFEILSESDEDGEYKKILDHSDHWKKILKEYCNTEEKFTEISSKCEVAVSTVKLWLKESSNTKFPQEIVGLVDLLGDDFDSILESKENFGSISIAIGRDLADDVTDYIISKHRDIGPTLNQFDHSTINIIADQNMPIKVIKSIITEEIDSNIIVPLKRTKTINTKVD